jgi:hypothetical protein
MGVMTGALMSKSQSIFLTIAIASTYASAAGGGLEVAAASISHVHALQSLAPTIRHVFRRTILRQAKIKDCEVAVSVRESQPVIKTTESDAVDVPTSWSQ